MNCCGLGFGRALAGLLVTAALGTAAFAQEQDTMSPQGHEAEAAASAAPGGLPPCEPLPTGELSDDELKGLVPEGSPGKVRIRWKTESQEENYGFNIMRADKQEGPYAKVNSSIIAGEGSTNIPKEYCFEDRKVVRGQTYFYFIESISTSGVKEVVEGTKDTKVKVKTVEEERAWLKAKALGQAAPAVAINTTATPSSDTATSASR